ncbi:dienelactone hydrolase family protein [Pusillimonas sp. CC-YST705]|uniref:Dienelactone hydrolase family protein n=1 Tax=Mesopusillimonas faecipullorum TaxID=2755040 RepID=A0ABS8CD45_9BURK|nr:dienelactone hydrolase family protein [Mesopusillimonas faecipullorum]MCB5363950.1 dienelactone hydrolase family protein [Mesopusillimonas faecipullorum]
MGFSSITGQAGTTIHTSAEGLIQGRVQIPTFDGEVDAYHAVQKDRQGAPVILVVQEIFGLHEHIQDVCRRLAHAGYFAIAVEHYQRQGDPNAYPDVPTLISQLVSKVPDEQVLADLDAAAEWAGRNGGDASRLGVTGYCWGGRITWLYAAHNPACKAGVAWYGKLVSGHGAIQKYQPIDIAGKLHAPVLGLYGGQDNSIPMADVERMQGELAQGNAASQASQIIVYPQAGHAFYADYRPSYREYDAQEGWSRMHDWFARYL